MLNTKVTDTLRLLFHSNGGYASASENYVCTYLVCLVADRDDISLKG